MNRSTRNIWLTRFAIFTALSTLALIGIGGLVTSHGAGMAVPDWPTTYGYNMFLFPPSYWIGGVFYEHTHRLAASFVGLLTTVLAVWLWLKESRRWLRWLGVIAFVAVVLQGVLGGLRVTLFKDELGIFHATLAQLFLVFVSLIALFSSERFQRFIERSARPPSRRIQACLVAGTVLILLQLILGATMRHQHAGLAIPDFPLAYGQVWPPMDEAFLEQVNRSRMDVRDYNPITAFQIGLHMAHRLTGLAIVFAVAYGVREARRERREQPGLFRLACFWAGLIGVQVILGAATVWSNKAADVATAHVVLGAASLTCGGILCALAFGQAAGRAGEAAAPSRVSEPCDGSLAGVTRSTV